MKKPNKERTAEEVYDDLVSQGAYEEASIDADEIEKSIDTKMDSDPIDNQPIIASKNIVFPS